MSAERGRKSEDHPAMIAAAMGEDLLRPLRRFVCPNCDVRFGLESSEWKFAEATGNPVFCPRGHRLRLRIRDES